MELKLTHEQPDEPTVKRDEATKIWSNADAQQPILFENVQLPQIENEQLPQIEISSYLKLKCPTTSNWNVQPPRIENVQKP